MGVKRCSRNGCEEIMCDRCSSRFGYICGGCFNELVDRGLLTLDGIREFMDSEIPCKVDLPEANVVEFYGNIFSTKEPT